MAKHKAATEITIAQEERSAFAMYVDRYKWHALAVLVVIAAVILWRQRSTRAEVDSLREDWARLYRAETSDDGPDALATAAREIERPNVAAWARVGQALALVDDRAYADAEQVLGQALTSGPLLLTEIEFPVGPGGAQQTLLDHMLERVRTEKRWMQEHPYVLENPPLPDDAPRVELVTERGSIVVGLYEDRAPLHVQNFLDLVESDYYDGTRFHRILPGRIIQGGDPKSREDDPALWGTGGPETTIPAEDTGLIHTAGVLAAAKKGGAAESSGSQFYLTASPQHGFDENYVVFGKVLEGLELVEEISNEEIREDKAETPVEPVTLQDAKRL